MKHFNYLNEQDQLSAKERTEKAAKEEGEKRAKEWDKLHLL